MELGNMVYGNSRGEFEVPTEWGKLFYKFLEGCGLDVIGGLDVPKSMRHLIHKDGKADVFENDTFKLMAYWWGDLISDEEELTYEELLPNFVYKPLGITFKWYKYPFRDSYMSKDITLDEFKAILNACKKSLGADDADVVKEGDYGVHIGHCCALHGCKYGNPKCPVVLGKVKQAYTCEYCDDEGIMDVDDFRLMSVEDKLKNLYMEKARNLLMLKSLMYSNITEEEYEEVSKSMHVSLARIANEIEALELKL